VDVFADVGYTGNSLAVFIDPPPLRAGQMLRITQELRHFESVFVTTLTDPGSVRRFVLQQVVAASSRCCCLLFGCLPGSG
jgi:predicted PhzF superfamily epimerase YddE/YHI9